MTTGPEDFSQDYIPNVSKAEDLDVLAADVIGLLDEVIAKINVDEKYGKFMLTHMMPPDPFSGKAKDEL